MYSFNQLFPHKPLIAVIHLLPLPGSPDYQGNLKQVYEIALQEVNLFKQYPIDGLIIENFRDRPFYPDQVPPETIAAMSAITREIVKTFDKPIGINVLRNDAAAAMAIATATEAHFIRVNVHIGASVTDQGLIQGKAFETLRLRASLKSNVAIFADVGVKHATPLGGRGLAAEAKELSERGSVDALIVSGAFTGAETSLEDIQEVQGASKCPVIIGSGMTINNLNNIYPKVDGMIVGSYFKQSGMVENPLDETRLKAFSDAYSLLK